MRELEWFEPGTRVAERTIAALELRLGMLFPSDLRNFLMRHSCASNPKENRFTFVGYGGESAIGNIGEVLGVDLSDSQGILATTEDLVGQLPSGVVPIIATSWGDYICLRVLNGNDSDVVYFAVGQDEESKLTRLASSFSELFDQLEAESDSEN